MHHAVLLAPCKPSNTRRLTRGNGGLPGPAGNHHYGAAAAHRITGGAMCSTAFAGITRCAPVCLDITVDRLHLHSRLRLRLQSCHGEAYAQRRQLIRTTYLQRFGWGGALAGHGIMFRFVTGTSQDAAEERALSAEAAQYGDFLRLPLVVSGGAR